MFGGGGFGDGGADGKKPELREPTDHLQRRALKLPESAKKILIPEDIGGFSVKSKLTLVHLTAGAVGGVAARTAFAPLSYLKTNAQIRSDFMECNSMRGLYRGLVRVYREEGFLAFYKGNMVAATRIVPFMGINFAVFENAKVYLKERSGGELKKSDRFVAGAVGGVCAVACTYPLDVIKTNVVVAPVNKDGVKVAFESLREYGIPAFYRGLGPTLVGVTLYKGLQFGIYDSVKHWWLTTEMFKGGRDMAFYHHLACGAAAGLLARRIAYPFDVIRKRVQVTPTLADTWGLKPTASSTQIAKATVEQEGLRALYSGRIVNRFLAVPSTALTFMVYEQVKQLLNNIVL